ncbi:hypothetical protein D3C72_1674710 [compost metagenome]
MSGCHYGVGDDEQHQQCDEHTLAIETCGKSEGHRRGKRCEKAGYGYHQSGRSLADAKVSRDQRQKPDGQEFGGNKSKSADADAGDCGP